MSRAIIDCRAKVPRPGQENTVSTKTAPETTAENCNPAKVTTGFKAFLRACLTTTWRSDNPLARAVRI